MCMLYSQCMYIVFILQCQKAQRKLANYIKIAETNGVIIVLMMSTRILLPPLTVAQHESGTRTWLMTIYI